tara:strand:+ start:1174 stop:2274 length:1101 start_codon:yes stop_codon:yes gene_type:complete
MASSFGSIFRIHTFGESHGPSVGVVIDGCPPRLPLEITDIQHDLDRRRPGQSSLVTQRDEADVVEVLSGVYEGYTLGTPLALTVGNKDHQSGAYDHLKNIYRPSHADYTTDIKYGIRAHEGGGRASARETVGRVAAGAVARKILSELCGIQVLGWVQKVHTIESNADPSEITLEMVESHATRCPDEDAALAIEQAIKEARKDGNSLGGIVQCVARKVPSGLGDPVFDKLEADLAKGLMSLPAAKGFEIGSGFRGTTMTGRDHNDIFQISDDGQPHTLTNNSGGVQGGISNGEDILVNVAFKPTATISSTQNTIDKDGNEVELAAKGRHDPCVLPRAVPMVEAMICLVLCDALLRQRSVDVFPYLDR